MIESPKRSDFRHFHPVFSRYQDNDVNGLITGATIHGYFETAIQAFLLQQVGLDLREGELAAYVISSAADFLALPSFPDQLEVGLGVMRAAGSTVEYQLMLFRLGEQQPCAAGRVVQVFVERHGGAPMPLPPQLEAALGALTLGNRRLAER
ncbi:acyl-CoA thioesterase [Pseudomonas fulva]|nr:thioesterase family protein [Pseudomonas fulva]MBF8778438.1 thioesterase family protein [Pseudomonas fulva]